MTRRTRIELARLLEVDEERGERFFRHPAYLPSGKALLFTIGVAESHSYDDAQVAVLSFETGQKKILIEGAKKEGKITWYTTLIVDQVVRPVKEAFEREYPFIQIDFYRGNAENLLCSPEELPRC